VSGQGILEVVRWFEGSETGRWRGASGPLQRVDRTRLDAFDPFLLVEPGVGGLMHVSAGHALVTRSGRSLPYQLAPGEALELVEAAWDGRAGALHYTLAWVPTEPSREGGVAIASFLGALTLVCGLLLATCTAPLRAAPDAPPRAPDRRVSLDPATFAQLTRTAPPGVTRRAPGRRGPRVIHTTHLTGTIALDAGPEPWSASLPRALPGLPPVGTGLPAPDALAWAQMCHLRCGDVPIPAPDILRKDLDTHHCTCDSGGR
jgi:hypothetical protein